MICLLLLPVVGAEDEVEIETFFLYPNGDVVKQEVPTESYTVDFTESDLALCNDLLLMLEETLPDQLTARHMQMLDLAQEHINRANTAGTGGDLEEAVTLLKTVYFEVAG